MDLCIIFYINCDHTIEYFEVLLKNFFVKMVIFKLDKEIQCVKNVHREVQVRTPPESVILDSMNDFI